MTSLHKKYLNIGELIISYYDNEIKSDRVVICVHGWMDHKGFFLPLVKYLRDKRDYRIIIPDLRGHGESSKPKCNYDLYYFVKDILTLINTIIPKNAKLILIGHSLGGIINQVISSIISSRIIGLVLLNSTANFTDHPAAQVVRKLMGLVSIGTLPLFALSSRLSFAVKIPSNSYKLKNSAMREFTPEIAILTFRNAVSKYNLSKLVKQMEFPILVVTAQYDYFLPKSHSFKLYRLARHADLSIVPNAAHLSLLENPRYIADVISDQDWY